MKVLEHPELLRDHERSVIGKHDATGADADLARNAGEVGGEDGGRGARDAGHVVVLGNPVAQVAETLDVAGQVERVAQRVGGRRVIGDDRKIEDGERFEVGRGHAPNSGRLPRRNATVRLGAYAGYLTARPSEHDNQPR